MAFFISCDHCGANLDPGERCDCKKEVVMVNNGEATEDIICEIIKKNPNTTTTGVVNRLKNEYGMKLSAEAARKFINRLIQFGGVRADISGTGAVTYSYQKEA